MTTTLSSLKERLPEHARDLKLNLSAIGAPGELSPRLAWGTALAAAMAARNPDVIAAIVHGGAPHLDEAASKAARAAASLMAMNNVYYRFRHQIGKEVYSQKPARLRMNRLVAVKGTKADFELMCLAVSAINGCETCVRAHEKTVLDAGLSEDQVHDAVRIAATVSAAALAVGLG